ncbi:helix-turn-helix domain-containing protein [Alsobacter soli]|uniref:helix-turn-helix domain-containing protein n=1 Tax=Alsobacter soli TaxID=2109933 RepID=UPI001304F310|nr:MarR family transcriptional regulator [Alsobacter soli]
MEVKRVYNGRNNGALAVSARALAERLGVSKDTAAKALRQLVQRGFLEVVAPSSFGWKAKRAAEYRLTDEACNLSNQAPSNAYRAWAPNRNTVRSDGRADPLA